MQPYNVKTSNIAIGDMELVCFSAFEPQAQPGWTVDTHFHFSCEFHYLQQGSVRIIFEDDRELVLQDGDMLLIPPYTSHYVVQCSPTVRHYSTQFFLFQRRSADRRTVSEYAYYSRVLEQLCAPTQLHSEELAFCIGRMTQESTDFLTRSDHFWRIYYQVFFIELCTVLKSTVGERLPAAAGPAADLSDHSRAWIIENFVSENYNRKIRLEALAGLLGLSKSQTVRTVKKLTGHTVSELMTQQRMSVTAILLRTTDLALEEIAAQLGYSAYSSFYEAVRATYRMSPEALRASLTAGA